MSSLLRTTAYGLVKTVPFSYDDAVALTRQELAKEGFGIVTELDVKATMKAKLDVDFRRYVILGACNPKLAHRALTTEIEVGLLLPCNVCVWENGPTESTVAAFDPLKMIEMAADRAGLEPVAKEVRERLERAVAAVGQPAR